MNRMLQKNVTVALWRVRGVSKSGRPAEIRVRSNSHDRAWAIARPSFASIESCVLLEGRPS